MGVCGKVSRPDTRCRQRTLRKRGLRYEQAPNTKDIFLNLDTYINDFTLLIIGQLCKQPHFIGRQLLTSLDCWAGTDSRKIQVPAQFFVRVFEFARDLHMAHQSLRQEQKRAVKNSRQKILSSFCTAYTDHYFYPDIFSLGD